MIRNLDVGENERVEFSCVPGHGSVQAWTGFTGLTRLPFNKGNLIFIFRQPH